jgi:hypothetical protein
MNLNSLQIKMTNDKIKKLQKQKINWLSMWVCLGYYIGEYNFLWSNFSKNQTKSVT